MGILKTSRGRISRSKTCHIAAGLAPPAAWLLGLIGVGIPMEILAGLIASLIAAGQYFTRDAID